MKTLFAIDGERWDTLCLRAYGVATPEMVKQLRTHNRELVRLHSFVLPGGAQVLVPEQNIKAQAHTVIELAPWQR